MKRGILISYLVLGALVLFSTHAMAQGGKIHTGKLKIIPGITVQGVYDDNIYLSAEQEEEDWITHVMPGLGLDYSLEERGGLSLGYHGDLAYYGENDQNDWQTHRAMFDFNYEAPGGLFLGISEIYTDAEDPYGSDEQYKLGVPKTKRWSSDLRGKIGYNLGNRSKILAFYTYYRQDYDLAADFTQDYDVNEFGVGYQMRALPKTSGFIRYHYGKQDYFTQADNVTEATDADSDWRRVNAGLTWDAGAKLSGELNVGYQWIDYENTTDPAGNRYDDKDTWIAATSITYAATAARLLTLNIGRALRTTGAGSNEYFEDTSVGINLRQMLPHRVSLIVGAMYSKNDYNLPREDDNYNVNIGLDYQIQDWLSAGAGYKYMKKDSNYAENDYTDNQFMISLRGVY